MQKTTAVTFVTLVLLALTGCGSDEAPQVVTATTTVTATPTPTLTLTPTAAPTRSTWTTEQAAQQYLVMVKPVNAANQELARISDPSRNAAAKTMAASCRKVANATYDFIAALRRGAWQADVQPDVTLLIEASKKDAAGNEKCAKAVTIDAVEAGFIMSQESGSSGAAAALRAALGLPQPTRS